MKLQSFKHPDESLRIKTKPALAGRCKKALILRKENSRFFAKTPNTIRKER
jgi:hypothetical protein